MEKEPMTVAGLEMLQKHLHRLITVERPIVLQAIIEARGHGDITENAEFEAAKEQQALLESKIKSIQDKLARAQVIDPASMNSDKIAFGATVTLIDVQVDQRIVYQIVGEDEADIKQGKVSIRSPIARAMLGKAAGDDVVFQAPGGVREFEVERIEYR